MPGWNSSESVETEVKRDGCLVFLRVLNFELSVSSIRLYIQGNGLFGEQLDAFVHVWCRVDFPIWRLFYILDNP